MNDEIKEILDYMKKESNYKHLSFNATKLLLDYITNLQQENLALARENEEEKQFVKDCGFENAQQLALDFIGIRQENERLKHQLKVQEDLTIKNRMRKHIYKSRCEKAVEYIKERKTLNWYADGVFVDDLLKILQNGSDSQ